MQATNSIKSTNFFSGGNATFTVSNPKGDRYTFKIRKPTETTPYFVSLLTGQDNENSYTYLGLFNPDSKTVVLTRKSGYREDSLPVRVVRWALKAIANSNVPDGYAIQHCGKCCRCGRKLTVPESIESGIGPECAKR